MFIPILAYHKIQNQFEFDVSYTKPKQFEKQIKYLFENDFYSISIDDYINGKNCHDKEVILTFDDAYSSVYEYAFPILERYNFTATIFVITKFVGECNSWDYHFNSLKIRHCNWQQIETLSSKGWEIGSHTVSHQNLKNLPLKELWYELRYSKDILENRLNKHINIFSYPFGSFSDNVIKFVKTAGYEAACTLGYNFPYNENFPYALFRRGVYFFEPLPIFKIKLLNNRLSHFDDLRQIFFSKVSKSSVLLRFLKSSLKNILINNSYSFRL